MRATIVIAAYNEGENLLKTIESCVETAHGLDYDISLADDGSTDGAPEAAARRFASVHLERVKKRQGTSAAKHRAAQAADGEVLIFLDGHCKPEYGALHGLVQAIEDTEGQAVITPRIVSLDVKHWRNILSDAGHGYAFDPLTTESYWVPLDRLQRSDLGRGYLYESPALIGCAFAVTRAVYDRVWGFDRHMLSWGVEDLDFALKCWLMGYPILHDPTISIGHRFQEAFTRYTVPAEHIVVNQLRMAYKNYTQGVWNAWLQAARSRNDESLAEHAEGLWARAWELFKGGEETARQERSYFHAHRVHDEFWYARRFGLAWPQLSEDETAGAAAPGPAGSVRPSGSPSPSRSPSPSPSPSRGPSRSPSPPPGNGEGITGPAVVLNYSPYMYRLVVPNSTPTDISWSSDAPGVSFVGPTDGDTVLVAFVNASTGPAMLQAYFTVNGLPQLAQMEVDVI